MDSFAFLSVSIFLLLLGIGPSSGLGMLMILFFSILRLIFMKSDSRPNKITTYYHSGMNDILPKPFTKEGLLPMLEVCGDFSPLLSAPGTDGDTRALETSDTPQGNPADG